MSVLEDLAARYGVQRRYHTIDGREFRPPPETLRTLLAAFGVAAGTEAEEQASLAAAPPADEVELRAPERRRLRPARLARARPCLGPRPPALPAPLGAQLGNSATSQTSPPSPASPPPQAPTSSASTRCTPCFSPPPTAAARSPPRTAASSTRSTSPSTPCRASTSPRPSRRRSPPPAPPTSSTTPPSRASSSTPCIASGRPLAATPTRFARFRAAGGEALERHARFEAISARMAAEGHGAGWTGWPAELQDPASAAVAAFAESHADDVAFHAWLQWLADRQLGEARDAALDAGMRLGLYLDFAVGEVPDGSSTWSDRHVTVPGVHVGAPPDYFSAAGQDWELAPLSPVAVAEPAAAPFRALIDDATRRAGALRIDHAMALWQLFLIPAGASPAEGTYVRFPIEAMLAALAEASRANGTVIIGEDLGNVPDGFREVMDAGRILSYRILLFERDAAGLHRPRGLPEQRARLPLDPRPADLPGLVARRRRRPARRARPDRPRSRRRAGRRPRRRAAQPPRRPRRRRPRHRRRRPRTPTSTPRPTPSSPPSTATSPGAPSRLFAVRLEDLAGERAPVNLPGTVDQYPNWRRRLPIDIAALPDQPLWREVTAALRAERPRLIGACAPPTACSSPRPSASPTPPRSRPTSPISASATSMPRRSSPPARAAPTATT